MVRTKCLVRDPAYEPDYIYINLIELTFESLHFEYEALQTSWKWLELWLPFITRINSENTNGRHTIFDLFILVNFHHSLLHQVIDLDFIVLHAFDRAQWWCNLSIFSMWSNHIKFEWAEIARPFPTKSRTCKINCNAIVAQILIPTPR